MPDGGGEGELVLTTLDRSPRRCSATLTGDSSAPRGRAGGCASEGGILGRIDDMLVVRGVNIYLSAIEAIVCEFPGVAEFQIREEIRDSTYRAFDFRRTPPNPAPWTPRRSKPGCEAFSLRIPVTLPIPANCPLEFKAKRLGPRGRRGTVIDQRPKNFA
ncbi:MAG: hypothetical protein R3F11_30270 [Verrucomicrobiales bacterium]